MLRTYFLQKFRKAAPYLVVLQLFVLAFCLYLMQNQQKRLSSLETQLSSYIEKDNLQWEEVVIDKLGSFEEKVRKEYRGFDYLERANITMNLLREFQTRINEFKSDKKLFDNEMLETFFNDFQKGIERELLSGMDTVDRRIINDELKFSRDKIGLLNRTSNKSPSSLRLELLENTLLTFTESAIDFFRNKLGGDGWIYYKYYAHVIPSAKTLQIGEILEADIFLDKTSSMYRPRIFVDDTQLPLDAEGVARYQLKAEKIGKHRIEGCIFLRNSFEGEKELPFIQEYTVLPKCN